MKIALFGGTGFVGNHIIDTLTAQEKDVCVFVRNTSNVKIINRNLYAKVIKGDFEKVSDVEEFIKGAEVVIFSIGIIRSFEQEGISFEKANFQSAKMCIDIAKKHSVKQFIMISANGVRLEGTDYQRTKFLAEMYLKESKIPYTILRPSVLFGDPQGCSCIDFCTQLKRDMISLPIPAPLFFKSFRITQAGAYELAPVSVEDFAFIITELINVPQHINKTYLACGESLSFKTIVKTIAEAIGKRKWFFPVSVVFVKILAHFF